jgi:hypothetical protein
MGGKLKHPNPNLQFRAVTFGYSIKHGRPIMVSGHPTEAEDCGIYIHIDDFEKWKQFEREFGSEIDQSKLVPDLPVGMA